jgi:hypothetical protein
MVVPASPPCVSTTTTFMEWESMKRKGLAVGIILLFIGTSVLPVTAQVIDLQEKYQVMTNGSNYSFHGNASSNSNWYVVKFSSDKPMILGDCCINVFVIQNRTQRHSGQGYRILLTNFQTAAYNDGGLWHSASSSDFYLQVDTGPLNFTINRLDNFTTNGLGLGNLFPYPEDTRTLSSGDWYLIIYTNHDGTVMVWPPTGEIFKGKIEVFINLSSEGNVTFFTPTEGHSYIYYESQDFHGVIVHKRPKLLLPYFLKQVDLRSRSIVLDGKAQFVVNHTFIGHFLPTFGRTFDHDTFHVITPQGNELKLNFIYVWNRIIASQGDFDYWDCIVGGNGTWNLDVDQIGFGKTPFVCFMGADILLPDTVLQSSHTPYEMVLHTSGNTFRNRVFKPTEKQEYIYSVCPISSLPFIISEH